MRSNDLPSARAGSNPIVQGSPDVVFDGLPAATLGSIGAHGNVGDRRLGDGTHRRRLHARLSRSRPSP